MVEITYLSRYVQILNTDKEDYNKSIDRSYFPIEAYFSGRLESGRGYIHQIRHLKIEGTDDKETFYIIQPEVDGAGCTDLFIYHHSEISLRFRVIKTNSEFFVNSASRYEADYQNFKQLGFKVLESVSSGRKNLAYIFGKILLTDKSEAYCLSETRGLRSIHSNGENLTHWFNS